MRIIGRQWASLNSLNCKMFQWKNKHLSFCQDARKITRLTGLSMITNKHTVRQHHIISNYNYTKDEDYNVFVIIILPNIHSPRNFMLTCSYISK